MRTYVRMVGVTAAVAAAMAVGSPAFAGGHEDHNADAVTHSTAGGGGESANTLSCLINIPIISPNSDQVCEANSQGGTAGALSATGEH